MNGERYIKACARPVIWAFIIALCATMPALSQEQEKEQEKAPIAVSFELNNSVFIPLLPDSAMSIGAMNSFYMTFQFPLGPGYLGAGALIGYMLTQSKNLPLSNYALYNFPAGVCLQYSFYLPSNIFIFMEANGGISLNWVRFMQPLKDIATLMPYAQGYLGLGIQSRSVSLSVLAGVMDVFFTNSQLLAVSGGVRLSFKQ
jgi:hypothetical protein